MRSSDVNMLPRSRDRLGNGIAKAGCRVCHGWLFSRLKAAPIIHLATIAWKSTRPCEIDTTLHRPIAGQGDAVCRSLKRTAKTTNIETKKGRPQLGL